MADLTAELVPDSTSSLPHRAAVRVVAIDLSVWQWAVVATKSSLGLLLVALIAGLIAAAVGLLGTILFSALGIAAIFAGGGA